MVEPVVPVVAEEEAVPAPQVLRPWWRRLPRAVWGLVGLVGLFVCWEIFTGFVAYTDDAYVRSDLIGIAPEVSGRLVGVEVTDNEPVAAGQLLARIDPVPFQLEAGAATASLQKAVADEAAAQDAVAAAQDEVAAAQALAADALSTAQRQAALGSTGFASRQTEEDAQAALQDAQANTEAKQALLNDAKAKRDAAFAAEAEARSALAIAQWKLAQTQLVAPAEGTLSNFNLRVGDLALQNVPLIGIVTAQGWRVIANYKQSYLHALRPGARAWVWLDSHPWHFYRARIVSLGLGIARNQTDTGLLPYVSPTTDWIRLQHRFPVTIELVNPPADLTLFMGADARVIVFP